MNLPNKLTMLRMVMVPFFVFFLLETPEMGDWMFFKWIALALFIVASLTDMLDGKIARKYNLVTNFGKLMDPLADKLLVCSALVGLTWHGIVPAWMTIIIIGREFIISGFRLIAAEKGVVIAASMWGKLKTVSQMIMICFTITVLNDYGFRGDMYAVAVYMGIEYVAVALMWIATLLTVISLVDYVWKNRAIMKENEK